MNVILPVRSVESFDSLGIQILHRLLITSTHTIIGACVSIEGIDRLGDSHLRCCHGCCNEQFCFASLSPLLSHPAAGFAKLTPGARAEKGETEFLPRKESK